MMMRSKDYSLGMMRKKKQEQNEYTRCSIGRAVSATQSTHTNTIPPLNRINWREKLFCNDHRAGIVSGRGVYSLYTHVYALNENSNVYCTWKIGLKLKINSIN